MEYPAKKHPPYRGIIRALLITSIAATTAAGWLVRYASSDEPMRGVLTDAHITLALLGAALLIIELLIKIFRLRDATPELEVPFRRTKKSLLAVVYISFALALVTGYGFVAFGPEPFQLWGATIPIWRFDDATLAIFAENMGMSPPQIFGWENVTLSQAIAALHMIVATVLTAAIIAFVGVVVFSNLFGGLFGERRTTVQLREATLELSSLEAAAPTSTVAKGLAQKVRIVGWMNLWLQLLLAFASGLLLQFARSGRAFGPSTPWLGEAVGWASYAFILLCVSVALTFFYIRSSKKILARPDYYLNHRNILAFWFLGLGLVAGTLGVVASFVGVSVSIWMLIAKVVSQPPGIAITNPTNFIRVLDIFILIVNVMLLLGHMLGAGSTLWLGVRTSRARLAYLGMGLVKDANGASAKTNS